MEMKFCPKCGNAINPGATFCTSCGTSIADIQQAAPFVVTAPVGSPVAAPAKTSEKRSGGVKTLSVLLCICLFTLASFFVALVGLRAATTEERGTEIVKSVVGNMDVRKIPAANLVADEDYDGSVADWIVEKAKAESNGKEDFDERDFEKYLEESRVVKQMTKRIGSLVWDIRSGYSSNEMDEKEFRELLESDREIIKKHLHFNISDKDIDQIVNEVEKSNVLDYMSADRLQEEASGLFGFVRFALSPALLWIVIGLMVLCLVLLALVNRWNLVYACGDSGITLTIAGALMLVSILSSMSMGGSTLKSIELTTLIQNCVSYLMKGYLAPCIGILVVGVALIVAKILLQKFWLPKRKA